MNRTILLIDDEPDIRDVFKVSLEAVAGWRVLTAAGGAEGAALAAECLPDAIVLDVMMPELDGPATLEVLRRQGDTRRIPVLFMTAKAQAGELSRIATLGVAGVIAKPFDPMSLHERIAGALGWDKAN